MTGCLILTAGEPDAATLRLKSERRFGPSPAIRSTTPVVVSGSSFTRGRMPFTLPEFPRRSGLKFVGGRHAKTASSMATPSGMEA